MQVTGPMEVQTHPDPDAASGYSRLILTKRYSGALEAAAGGEMLTGGDPKTGTAGYVAIELVTGTLDGAHGPQEGTFQLMQFGTLIDGNPELRCVVVPGSGTAALAGLAGTMQLARTPDGKHTYTLDYTLPAQ